MKSIIALALILAAQSVSARQLSSAEAFENAMGYSLSSFDKNKKHTSAVSQKASLVYTVNTDEVPTVYVFNGKAGGFYVVAANDAVPVGLLGYTDSGSFDPNNIPQNISGWLEQYGREVSYASSVSDDIETANASASTINSDNDRASVAPILKTRWGQTGVFSAYTPVVNDKHCPVGCIATSMGQVMNAYGYPSAGIGSVTYTASKIKQKLTYDFEANPINWEAIQDGNARPASDESADAVAQLLYACGVSVKMNYGPTGSGSYNQNAARALYETFGYDGGMRYLKHAWFSNEDWNTVIYNEVAAGRPVMYAGSSEVDGGHSFVCDGYDSNGYYHINWGWDGYLDGYFLLSALDPRGNYKGFDLEGTIITGIRPAVEGSTIAPVASVNGDITLNSYDVSNRYGSCVLSCDKGFWNQSISKTMITFGVKLRNVETGEVIYIPKNVSNYMVPGQAITKITVAHSKFPTSGRWYMTTALKGEGEEWVECYNNEGVEKAFYVDCEEKHLTFTAESDVIAAESVKDINVTTLSVKSDIVIGHDFEIAAHFENTSSAAYIKYLTPTIIDEGETVSQGTKLVLDLSGYEINDSQWSCSLSQEVMPGEYTMALIDRKGNVIGNAIAVKVIEESPAAIEDTIADNFGADNLDIVETQAYNLSGNCVASWAAGEAPALAPGVYVLRHVMSDNSVKVEKKAIR